MSIQEFESESNCWTFVKYDDGWYLLPLKIFTILNMIFYFSKNLNRDSNPNYRAVKLISNTAVFFQDDLTLSPFELFKWSEIFFKRNLQTGFTSFKV